MPTKRSADSSSPAPEASPAPAPAKKRSAPRRKATAVTHKHKKTVVIAVTAPSSPSTEPTHDEIAALAYSYWEARGRQGGSPAEDWLRAVEELRARAGSQPS
jgi:hypothetical protein